nr:hypothetical protein GCM10020092_092670 [Actinoplanes digitatis]
MRQRAEAIGSVLSSFVTAVVFTIATLLVLGELGFNLAPLLASAGIVGVAVGFGAQSLVKDLIAGLFMLLEDQYGVGDTVDLGDAIGIVETVGLRVTTVRDMQGVLWYVRNGEIIRVGNKSQGWAMVVIDVPIGFVNSEEATAVLRAAALALAEEPSHSTEFLEPPEVIGVDQLTVDGAVIRTIAKTTATSRITIQRELRRSAHRGAGDRRDQRADRRVADAAPRGGAPELYPPIADPAGYDRGALPDLCERHDGGDVRPPPNGRHFPPYALARTRTIGQNLAKSICTCSVTFARAPNPEKPRERVRLAVGDPAQPSRSMEAWCRTTDPPRSRPNGPAAGRSRSAP